MALRGFLKIASKRSLYGRKLNGFHVYVESGWRLGWKEPLPLLYTHHDP